MRILSLIVGLLLIGSCTSLNPKADPKLDAKVVYKRDMELTVNGKKSTGVIVVPKADSYSIGAVGAGKLDLFKLTSCHREMSQQLSTNSTTIVYSPVIGLEDANCLVRLGGYEKERGRHSWGAIDFESPDMTMPATLKCNGVVTQPYGVSICQSLEGLMQEIDFAVPMIASVVEQEGCPVIAQPADNRTFKFKIPKGECGYAFLELQKGTSRKHRLTTIGYEEIIYRDK